MSRSAETDGTGPDIVLLVLQRVRDVNPGLTDEQAQVIEVAIKAEYGGLRVRIPKRKKHPSPEQRRAVFDDAIGSAESDDAITSRHGISRRSLYRYIKTGGA
jgi:hypothetical protein